MTDIPDKLKSILSNVSNIIERSTDNYAFKYKFAHSRGFESVVKHSAANVVNCMSVPMFVLAFTNVIIFMMNTMDIFFVYFTKHTISMNYYLLNTE